MIDAVMISMVGREEAAQETAERFEAIGVNVEIFVQPEDWPIGPPGNNRNSARAIASRFDHQGPLLFLEDDLIIKPDRMTRAIEAAKGANEVTYFYMHDKPDRVRRNYPPEPWIEQMRSEWQFHPSRAVERLADVHPDEGLRQVPFDAPMYGSQAVFIPHCYKRFLHDEMTYTLQYQKKIKSGVTRAIDTALNDFRVNHRLPTFVYLPHPVQHLQNRQKRSGRRMDVYSHSFDLLSKQEAESA